MLSFVLVCVWICEFMTALQIDIGKEKIEMSATIKCATGAVVVVRNNDVVHQVQCSTIARVVELKQIFTEIKLSKISFKIVQTAPVGHGQLNVGGVVYVGLVPSSWTLNDIASKKTQSPELKMFGLGYEILINEEFTPELSTFELDLGQIARRGAHPQIVMSVFGARAGQDTTVISVQVIYELQCTGESYGA